MWVKVLAMSLLILYCCYGTEVNKRKRKRENETNGFTCTNICYMERYLSLQPTACEKPHEFCVHCVSKLETNQCPMCRKSLPTNLTEYKATFYEISDLNPDEQKEASYFAVKQANINALKALAKKKIDLNRDSLNGKTLVWNAARHGHTEIVKFLATKNVDLDAPDIHGKTPLWVAARYGHIEIVEFFAAENVDLNQADNKGKTPLYVAVSNRHTEIVKILIENNVKLEENVLGIARSKEIKRIISEALNNQSNFMKAVRAGELEVVKDLARKVDLNRSDEQRHTPVYVAAEEGHTKVVEFLATFKNVDLDLVDKDGFSPVLIATKYGHTEVVKFLATKNVDLNRACYFDWEARTPVNIATMLGHKEIVKILIEKNVKLEKNLVKIARTGEIKRLIAGAFQNQSNFLEAVRAGQLGVVKDLAGKVDLNRVDEHRSSPVYMAAEEGHTKVVEFLATFKNVDLDLVDKDGCTPVWIATKHGHTEVVKFLARKNVDLNRACYFDWEARTPVSIAVEEGHTETVRFLIEKNVKLEKNLEKIAKTENIKQLITDVSQNQDDFMKAVEAGQLDNVKALIGKADLNRRDFWGRTSVLIAARFGHKEIVKFLIENNVKLEEFLLEFAKTEEIKQIISDALKHQSNLMEAVRDGQLDDVKFLAKKVDLNRANKYGKTPIYVAARYGHTEIVKFFASKNVDLNSDNKGQTPLHAAARFGYTEIVEFLIEKKVKLEENLLEIAKTKGIKQIITDALKKQSNFLEAVRAGHLDLVKSLAGKVDLNQVYENEQNLVWIATKYGQTDIVKFLATRNVDMNRANTFGEIPVYIAARDGYTEIVKFFAKFKNFDLDGTYYKQEPLVWIAARFGHKKLVEFLATKNVDLNRADGCQQGSVCCNKKCRFGETPVHVAARFGHTDVVKFLATKNVCLNQVDKLGHTLVRIAAREGHRKTVKFLIEKKVKLGKYLLEIAKTNEIRRIIADALKNRNDFLEAVRAGRLDDVKSLAGKVDLNRADKRRITPVYIAAEFGYTEIVKFFATFQNVDLDPINQCGETPVWIAARNGHTDVVEFLATFHIVDLDRADTYGHTLVRIAAEEGYEEIVKVLIEKRVKLGKYLLEIAKTEEIKLIISGAFKKQKNFMKALRDGQLDIVKDLAGKIDLNRADDGGRNLAYIAAVSRDYNIEILKFLAEKNVDLNRASIFEDTPLHAAVTLGYTENVKFLASFKSVDLNQTDKWGCTPVMIAAREGHKEIVEFLIEKKVKLRENRRDLLEMAKTREIEQIIAEALKK